VCLIAVCQFSVNEYYYHYYWPSWILESECQKTTAAKQKAFDVRRTANNNNNNNNNTDNREECDLLAHAWLFRLVKSQKSLNIAQFKIIFRAFESSSLIVSSDWKSLHGKGAANDLLFLATFCCLVLPGMFETRLRGETGLISGTHLP